MAINEQDKITVPFANSGLRNDIPETATGSNLASMQEGFPAITMTDIASGGQPPDGKDFNGILNVITKILQYAQSGGLYKYDADYAEAVNGYPKGALLLSSDGSKIWMNTTDNNKSNPDDGGQNWTQMPDISKVSNDYLKKSGGTMTGQVTSTFNGAFIKQGADNSMVGILGGTSNSGGCGALWLYGKNSSEHTAGWVLRSSNGANVSTLECNPSGVLKLNNNEVLTTASTLDASKLNVSYLPTKGGTMTGDISVNASDFQIYHVPSDGNSGRTIIRGGDYNFNSGASAYFHGVNHATRAGYFDIYAHDGTVNRALSGTPSGYLSWSGNEVLTTANGLSLSGGTMTGNITLGSSGFSIRHGSTWADIYNGNVRIILSNENDAFPNQFAIQASDGVNIASLRGRPNGSLTWKDKEVERVNESGTNYIRYENGIQMCWGTGAFSGTSTAVTQSLPKAFSGDTSYRVMLEIGGLETSLNGVIEKVTEYRASYFKTVGILLSNGSNAHSYYNGGFRYLAVGYWK